MVWMVCQVLMAFLVQKGLVVHLDSQDQKVSLVTLLTSGLVKKVSQERVAYLDGQVFLVKRAHQALEEDQEVLDLMDQRV